MTVHVRLLYSDAGDHIAFRDASEYIVDPRDRDETRTQLRDLDARLAQVHDAVAAALHERVRDGNATLADLEKAAADKAAATERYAAERQAIVDAAFEQVRNEAQTRQPIIAAEPDEVEFYHAPSEAELDAAFPNCRQAAVTR